MTIQRLTTTRQPGGTLEGSVCRKFEQHTDECLFDTGLTLALAPYETEAAHETRFDTMALSVAEQALAEDAREAAKPVPVLLPEKELKK